MINLSKIILLAGITLAFGVRSVIRAYYPALEGNDTPSYVQLAEIIKSGDFSEYNGRRTPGYSLFISLFSYQVDAIRLVQHLAGLISCLLVYRIVFLHAGPLCAACLVMIMGISIQFPFYESIIITESLSLLFVLIPIYMLFPMKLRGHWGWAIAAGGVAGFAALIRPHLVILIPSLFLGIIIEFLPRWRASIARLLAFVFPAMLLLCGWMFLNKVVLGTFTLSTLPKRDLISHMIPLTEHADERFGDLGRAYARAYEELNEEVRAEGDNRAAYGMRAAELYQSWGHSLEDPNLPALTYDMAVDLIKKYPGHYLLSVLDAWHRFWRVHIIVYPENCTKAGFYQTMMTLWMPVKVMWLVMNIAFILLIPALPWLWTRMSHDRRALLLTLYLIMMAASASQAITQYFDNARFAVPFQPLVAIALLIVADAFIKIRQSNAREE